MSKSKKRTVILGEHFDKFVDGAVSGGQYLNADEVLREALRELETKHRERVSVSMAPLVNPHFAPLRPHTLQPAIGVPLPVRQSDRSGDGPTWPDGSTCGSVR